MASGKKSQVTTLLKPRSIAAEEIEKQIHKAKSIQEYQITYQADLTKAKEERTKWKDYTKELLLQLFDNDSIANDFDRAARRMMVIGDTTLEFRVSEFQKEMKKYILNLESIKERIPLFKEPEKTQQISSPTVHVNSKKVFIVHGHDNEVKETVARFIEKLGLVAVILHEQYNGGKTIIEKLERDSSDIAYAIVLLTPDDYGHPKDFPDQSKLRARQNVILELGYFMGLIGRDRVAGLIKSDIEIPTDFQGVCYINLDANGAWRLMLAKEMKAAGINIDINDAV